MNSDSSR